MYTMQNFKDICRMSQKELKKHVASELRTMYKSVTEQKGFVYAQGTFPVLLVAHLDTVHTFLPGKIKYKKDKLWSPNGIGGDDRCGVYMILNIIEKYNLSMEIRADYIFGIKDFGDLENAVCIINDCQNILGPNQIVSDGVEAQGTEIIQILEKRDNILKLEA